LPINSLKIDRSFVRDLATDPDDAAIITAIIAMAHGLKLKVVAEGVETQAQLAFLRARGCDEYQGFLMSRPLEGPAFARLFEDRRHGSLSLSAV
jgi:EAL domain-containing protein (putative c-di-GMP-specific phosphodiesterase class I)